MGKILEEIKALRGLVSKANRRAGKAVALVQTFRRNLTPMEVVLGSAGKVTRYSYRFDYTITTGSQDVEIDTKTITPATYFLKQRMTAHWLPTTGNGAARWWPVASSNPVIAAAIEAGAAITIPDFFYQVQDVASGRWLSDLPLPGDWLYRQDRDGFLTDYPSVFRGKNQVSIDVTLTRNAEVSGTLYLVMHGVQSVLAPKAQVTYGS